MLKLPKRKFRLDFARDCGYLSMETSNRLRSDYKEVGRMLGHMINHPEKFVQR